MQTSEFERMGASTADQRSRRLRRELAALKKECDEMQPKLYILQSPSDDLSIWTVEIMPGEKSVYHGQVLVLQLSFPERYPAMPLEATFSSNMYHPNVDQSGRIVGDVLSPHQWSPIVNGRMVVHCVLNLLDNPDLEGEIANEAAASMYLTHPDDYNAIAKTFVGG